MTSIDTSALPYRPVDGTDAPLAWCWFLSPRAIVDPDTPSGPRVLVGAVSGETAATTGDIVVLWRDLDTGDTGAYPLHENLEYDDHDDPALFIRPDGRYLAVYAKHGTDTKLRWRVSRNPHDPTAWHAEASLDVGANVTYANVYDAGDTTYCCSRAINWDPTLLTSPDDGQSWSVAGRFLTFDGPSHRPYPRYAQGEDGAVHLITTASHPHDRENGIGHGVIRDGRLTNADGTTLVADVRARDHDPADVRSLTTVFEPNARIARDLLTRAWTVDLATDGDRPVAIIQARHDDDRRDHRFLYARWTDDGWAVEPLARAGGYLYESQWDYTGLAAIDPTDTNRVLVSTTVDPRTGTDRDTYGLYAGIRTGEADWRWSPVAVEDTTDQLRPILAGHEEPVAAWMAGDYHSYTSWETTVRLSTTPFAGL